MTALFAACPIHSVVPPHVQSEQGDPIADSGISASEYDEGEEGEEEEELHADDIMPDALLFDSDEESGVV